MSGSTSIQDALTVATTKDIESDYGSDFDELEVTDLPTGLSEHVLQDRPHRPHVIRLLKRLRDQQHDESTTCFTGSVEQAGLPDQISYEYIAEHIDNSTSRDENRIRHAAARHDSKDDIKTPLERFRTKPKKPLSVTDLVAPAWCELNYWYSLTKYGRIISTPRMRAGTKVHKALEDQVHHTVAVRVETREDAFGLRIFNIIQSLRTLRATGLTRELEVWGIIDGQVVNGVIDELSTTCPDAQLEAKTLSAKSVSSPDPKQRTIDTIFMSTHSDPVPAPADLPPPPPPPPATFVYIGDVKTRHKQSIPRAKVMTHPARMQLHIYHKLLRQMISGSCDKSRIFERLSVDDSVTFSDVLVAQVGGLGSAAADDQDPDTLDVILENNTLARLWDYMMTEYRKTFAIDQPHCGVSDLLKIEYRSRETSEISGSNVFVYEDSEVDRYLTSKMAFWKGLRPAVGVEIEESFKCQTCSFADVCEWRKQKSDEVVERAQSRRVAQLEQTTAPDVKKLKM